MSLVLLAVALAQPTAREVAPVTVHGQLVYDDDGVLLAIERAQVTVFLPGTAPWSYSVDGPFVGAGTRESLAFVQRGPMGLWAVFRPNVGIPQVRSFTAETPTWHLARNAVTWTAEDEVMVPIGASPEAWLAVRTRSLDGSDPVSLQVVSYDGADQGPVLPLPPDFQLAGHDTRQLPMATLQDGRPWVVAGGAVWRHDDDGWTSPIDGRWAHVLAHGDRVLTVARPSGWALHSAEGERVASGDAPVLGATFSDDGRWVALGLRDELRVLDASTGDDRLPPRPGRYQVPHAFSPGGHWLAVLVGGRPVKLSLPIDVATPAPGPRPDPAPVPEPHHDELHAPGLVARAPGDLRCRGAVSIGASGQTVQLVDAHHGIFPPREAPVVDGVARFDDVPCGNWRLRGTDVVDLWIDEGEHDVRGGSWTVAAVHADGTPAAGASITYYDRQGRPHVLGVTDAAGRGAGAGSLGPLGALVAETADGIGVGSARGGGRAGPVGIQLVAKDSLWRVQAVAADGTPVPHVAVNLPAAGPASREAPDRTYTNDRGEAWLPSEAAGPTVRAGKRRTLADVGNDGRFRVDRGRVELAPIDDGLRVAVIDALGRATPARPVQGQPRRVVDELAEGPARLEVWRGERCVTTTVVVPSDAPVEVPEPPWSDGTVVTVRVVGPDGEPIEQPSVWRAAPTDPLQAAGRIAGSRVATCGGGELVVAADPATGRWGLGDGRAPVVTRLEPSVQAAVVLGPGGVVVEPSPQLGLRRHDRVVRWGRERTDRWTAVDAALAVWGATEATQVKVERRDGGRAKVEVPAPRPAG